MTPSAMSPYHTIGNVCVAIAALIFLLPLQHLLSDYARKEVKDNLKRLHRWGAAMFPVLTQKFAGTDVDFAAVIADFEEHFGPTKRGND